MARFHAHFPDGKPRGGHARIPRRADRWRGLADIWWPGDADFLWRRNSKAANGRRFGGGNERRFAGEGTASSYRLHAPLCAEPCRGRLRLRARGSPARPITGATKPTRSAVDPRGIPEGSRRVAGQSCRSRPYDLRFTAGSGTPHRHRYRSLCQRTTDLLGAARDRASIPCYWYKRGLSALEYRKGSVRLKLSSRAKNLINGTLNKFNLELSTRTALTLERERVGKLINDGYFDRVAFPLLKVFSSFDAGPIIHGYTEHREDCRRLLAAGQDPRRYNPINNFFSPADACPAYLIARIFQPKTWVEIGSGNSTRVVRQAISDGKLATNLICIDPYPRVDISSVADEVIRSEVQTLPIHSIVDRLNRNDVLFINSSHELKAGGDVTYLLLNVIPKTSAGCYRAHS